MRLVSISDIHINSQNYAGLKCFEAFCNHPLVKNSTHIAFLGDIFDLMAGNHQEYESRWEVVWNTIEQFCAEGKIVYFAEGNHDMHLKKLLEQRKLEWKNAHHLIHIYDYLVVSLAGKRIHLSHGDELNRNDLPYLRYKKFIKKPWLGFVADHLMPLSILDYLGEKASKQSRKYGSKKFNEVIVRDDFRNGLSDYVGHSIDIIVGGHSHVEDSFNFEGMLYLNNGYPPKSQKFVVIDNQGGRLETLLV